GLVHDAGDRPGRAVHVRLRRDLAGGVAVAERDAPLALEPVERVVVGVVGALAVGDRQAQHLPAREAARERWRDALHAQVDVAALEPERAVARELPREQAGLGEHLEAVADAEDRAAAPREPRHRPHHRAVGREGAAAQVVAEAEAAGQYDGERAPQVGLVVPDEPHRRAQHVPEGVEGVGVAVAAREADYGYGLGAAQVGRPEAAASRRMAGVDALGTPPGERLTCGTGLPRWRNGRRS